MKLSDPSSSTKNSKGVNAGVVNQILEVGSIGKRSRPSSTSSLDYKPKRLPQEKLTTTKPTKSKMQQQQQPPSNQQQQFLQPRRSPTRAQGGSGPPPRIYDFSGLEDPDLAARASEGRGTTSPPVISREGNNRRSIDGSTKYINEYPEHLRELMDGGVPVTQWIILLVLLGSGFYQLRTILVGSDKTTRVSALHHKTSEKGGKSKSKKLKKKNDKTKVAIPKSSSRSTSTENERIATALPSARKSSVTTRKSGPSNAKGRGLSKGVGASSTSKKPTGKKKKKAPAGANRKDKIWGKEQTDLAADEDEGESNTKKGSTTFLKADLNTAEIVSDRGAMDHPLLEDERADDVGGWQTVCKSRAPVVGEAVPIKKLKKTAVEVGKTEELPLAMSEKAMATDNDTNGQSTNNSVEATPERSTPGILVQTKPEKTKNKEKASANAPAGAIAGTEDDAVLALRLQQEEENLAKGESAFEIAEVWEEVTTRKRRGTRDITAA